MAKYEHFGELPVWQEAAGSTTLCSTFWRNPACRSHQLSQPTRPCLIIRLKQCGRGLERRPRMNCFPSLPLLVGHPARFGP